MVATGRRRGGRGAAGRRWRETSILGGGVWQASLLVAGAAGDEEGGSTGVR